MSATDTDRAIYAAIVEKCTPMPLPGPWGFLGPVPGYWQPPANSQDLRDHLEGRFSIEILQKAGILNRAKAGLELAPALTDRREGLLVLDAKDGDPRPGMLLSGRGSFPKNKIPFLMDPDPPGTLATRTVFAAFSVADVAVLRALGCKATLATELTAAKYGAVQYLSHTFRGYGKTLVLLAWSLAGVSMAIPPGLFEFAEFLRQVRDHRDLDLDGIAAWRPGDRALEALRLYLGFSEKALIEEWLREAMKCNLYDITACANPTEVQKLGTDRGPSNCSEALRALSEALEKHNGRFLDEAWDVLARYEEFVERDLVQPLLRQGENCTSPVERIRYVQLANLVREQHRLYPLIHNGIGARAEYRSGRTTSPALAEYWKFTDRIERLCRHIKPSWPGPRYTESDENAAWQPQSYESNDASN